jgi:hypothetical protein
MIALQNAFGGGLFGGLVAFGIIFGITVFGFLLIDLAVVMQVNKNRAQPVHVNPVLGEGVIIFMGVLELIGFSAIGVLPQWVPLLLFAGFAWLLAQSIWSNKRTSSGGPA